MKLLPLAFVSFCLVWGLGLEAAHAVIAKDFKGLTKLADGRQLFVDYTVAQKDKPTVVVINGLTNSTVDWTVYATALRHDGYGVFLYDAFGMGQTLLNNPIPQAPIKYTQQVVDLKELLDLRKIQGPFNFVGLSYGGGITAAFAEQYPELVNNMILMSPYTEFLESTKALIKSEIKATRQLYPLNNSTDEELTDFFVHQFVYQTYPLYEPSTLANPFILEGVSRIVQGIRMYQPVERAATLPERKLHLLIAANDQYIKKDVLEKFWGVAGPAQASLVVLNYCGHNIPELAPHFAARWTESILSGNSQFYSRQRFVANPWTLEVETEAGQKVELVGKK